MARKKDINKGTHKMRVVDFTSLLNKKDKAIIGAINRTNPTLAMLMEVTNGGDMG